MQAIKDFIFIVLVSSVTASVITELAPKDATGKYVQLVCAVLILAMLVMPIYGVICEIDNVLDKELESDVINESFDKNITSAINMYRNATEDATENILYSEYRIKAKATAYLSCEDEKNIFIKRIVLKSNSDISKDIIRRIEAEFLCKVVCEK